MMKRAIKALILSSLFAAVTLGSAFDQPELPRGDGKGYIPDMVIKLVPTPASAIVSKTGNVRLSSYRGKVTMLDLFWTECSHCVEHAPHMVALYNQYKSRGLNILGLATDREDKVEAIKTFVKNMKISYPVGYFTTEVQAYYTDPKNGGVPQMILFGADGKMIKRFVGWNADVEKDLKATLEASLGKTAAKPSSKAAGKTTATTTKRTLQ